jgi:hypothetical protein
MDHKTIMLYYAIKRFFLFLDEWGFYIILYVLYKHKYHKINTVVFLYGAMCIYTSYSNIGKIEKQIFDEEQSLFVVDTPIYNSIKKLISDYNILSYFTKKPLLITNGKQPEEKTGGG